LCDGNGQSPLSIASLKEEWNVVCHTNWYLHQN
jgi:hypothetical protein